MWARVMLVSFFASAFAISALTAGEIPQSKSDDAEKARQLAEEKHERAFVALIASCQRMLDLQSQIHSGTQKLHQIIEGHPDKTPRPEDARAALKLLESAKECVKEVDKALDIVAKESALAFPEIFEGIRKDMKRVQRCLERSDVGAETQALEQDIVEIIIEMMMALQKG
jgi:hypothetical protein